MARVPRPHPATNPPPAAHRELRLPAIGFVHIAVISDTHSHAHARAHAYVQRATPDLILHAGDIGSRDVLEPFEAIAPTLAVRGNIDVVGDTPDIVTVHVTGDPDYKLRIVMTHIALYGPRLRQNARTLVRKHRAHLLICGHSHVPFLGEQSGTILFNPGSIGPKRGSLPICFGLMELGPGHTRIRHVDCETGDTWLPPSL